MRTPSRLLIAAAFLLGAQVGLAYETRVANLVGDEHRGKQLYRRYCVGCHGARGDGLGDNAAWVDPKPRDFTTATFKCRSTPTGTLPTDEDLYNTIGRGVHATAMPSWQALTRQQRIDLVAYIKSFSHRFQEEKPGTPVVIPAETSSTVQSVERGGELFQKMNCWSCHGKQGHGNGPSAIGLTDSKGYPITPYDFTSTTQFKCGEGDQDIFRVLMTGLDGTPMPSFSDALDPSQTWDLVHFVKTFRSSGRKTVFAKKANGNTGTTQQDINGNKGKVSGGKGDGNGHK